MKLAAVVVLFAVCVAAAQMQPGPAQRAQAQTAKASISGKVVNSVTGETVRKTSIILAPAGGRGQQQARTAVTDEQGVFSFAGVEPGAYRLIATRVGFVRQAYGERDPGYGGSGSVLNVGPGEEVKDVLFRLQPAAAISGRVVDQDGDPLMHARVMALRWQFVRGQRVLLPRGSDESNDRGEYRVYDLPPGRYYLSATYEGGYQTGYLAGLGVEVTDQAYVPVFYPGTNDAAQASAVEVRGGDDVPGINLMIVPQRAVAVSGRVSNSVTGQVGRNVHVSLMRRSLTMRAFLAGDHDTSTDEQGAFRLRGVPPGSYVLSAEWQGEGQGAGRRHYSTHQPVEVGSADIDGLSLIIAPGVDIPGSVKIEGAFPAPSQSRPEPPDTVVMGTRVMRGGSAAQMRVLLESLDEPSIGANATVKPDNTFVLENLSEGTYRVTVIGLPGNAYLKSARLGNQEVLEDGLVVVRGRRSPLELVVSTLTGRLEGNALDGDKPFPGARVVLVPEGARRNYPSWYRSVTSDEYGHFVFGAVPPGDYKLFAWDSVEPGAYQDPEFLRPFEDRGQTVRITESGQSTAEIKVIITEERGAQ